MYTDSGLVTFTHIFCLFQLSSQTFGSSSGPSATSINVSLCSRLVSVLRKGFSQSPSVRLTIYLGLYDAVARNPGLCSDVLTTIYDHAVDMGWASLRSREVGGGLLEIDTLIQEDSTGNSVIVVCVV